MQGDFALKGFTLLRNFLTHEKIAALNTALRQFHTTWLAENPVAFAQGAINSAHLTRTGSSHNPARQALFDLIGSAKFMQQVTRVLGSNACFMNTQLFFDPLNADQRNYWHRDSQYHLSLSEQQESLSGPRWYIFVFPWWMSGALKWCPAATNAGIHLKN
jgi:hypothetical protein